MYVLPVLFFMIVYFAILFFITRFCYKKARNNGKNRKISFLFGVLSFLLLFLPVFWDYIPNRIYFTSFCKNDTKLQVYKTFEEWDTENPDVLETLIPFSSYSELNEQRLINPNYRNRVFDGISHNVADANQRILLYWSSPYFQKLPFNIYQASFVLFDIEKQEIIAKNKEIYSGPGEGLQRDNNFKIWLNDECKNNDYELIDEFSRKFNIFKN